MNIVDAADKQQIALVHALLNKWCKVQKTAFKYYN
jgi:hypothetical protein